MHWAKPVALISMAKVSNISMHIRAFPSLNSLFREQRKKQKRLPPEDESLCQILSKFSVNRIGFHP